MTTPDKKQSKKVREGSEETRGERAVKGRSTYSAPRIVKKRAVSRATLFTGSGPESGGIVGSG